MPVIINGDGSISGMGSGINGVGKVRQVVNANATATVSTTSGTPVSIGLSTTITVAAGSRLYVSTVVSAYGVGSGVWTGSSRLHLFVNGVEVWKNDHIGTVTSESQVWNIPLVYYGSALTAGSYTVDVRGSSTNGGTIDFNRSGNSGAILVVMEVAA